MATIHVDIVSAEGEIFSGEAAMVFVPAVMGDIGIAPRHAPLLTLITEHSLDDDYHDVARRRGTTGDPTNGRPAWVTASVVAVFGILVATAAGARRRSTAAWPAVSSRP